MVGWISGRVKLLDYDSTDSVVHKTKMCDQIPVTFLHALHIRKSQDFKCMAVAFFYSPGLWVLWMIEAFTCGTPLIYL